MKTRQLNKRLIREWIKINGKGSATRLAFESGCSPSFIQKLCNEDYEANPTIEKLDGICRATGYSLDELFPVCETEKEIA